MTEKLNSAVRHHQAGQLQQAEQLYREVLRASPQHADALLLLGMALRAQGRSAEAVASYEQALQIRPDYVEAHNNLGNALRDVGKPDEAFASYQRAVEIKPGYAEAHNNLGVAFRDRGQWEEAAASCRRALQINPNYPEAHYNLGKVFSEQGQHAEAVTSFQRALQLKPDYAEAYKALGNALATSSRFDEAEASYRRALNIKPDDAETHNNLANVLGEQGKFDKVEVIYRQALALAPMCAETHSNLGNAMRELGRLDDAVSCYERAIQLKPGFSEAHNNLGTALRAQRRFDEAIASYRSALEINPDDALAHNNLGNVFQDEGDLDRAVTSYQQALKLKPDYGEAYVNLVGCRRISDACDPTVQRLEQLLVKEDLPALERCHLHFGLGKIYDDCEKWDAAFSHYQRGNALVDADFDADRAAETVSRMINTCTRSMLERGALLGIHTEVPVLIVGMPRSGTSLVEQILASHPAIFGAGELPTMNTFANTLQSLLNSNVDYPQCLPELDRTAAHQLATDYLARIESVRGGAVRVTDKLPANFMHLGLIALLLPGARIIHIRRRPLDVCLSCFFQNFTNRSGLSFTFDLQSLGCFHRLYARLMEHWRHVLPLSLLEVDYEDLVAEPEEVSRRLIEFCGLEWDPACLEFHKTRRFVQTASNWQVRQPLYARSVGRWKHYEQHLEPLKASL